MFYDIEYIFDDILNDEQQDVEFMHIIEGPRRDRVFRPRIDNIDLWSDMEFLNRFRLSKDSVRSLLNRIENNLRRQSFRNHALSPITQLLLTLRFYATGSMLILAGDFAGIDKSTASQVVKNVSHHIASLAPHFIKMPTTQDEIIEVKEKFYEIARFPNCIGGIDCTHVPIQSPGGDNAEQFRNRKGFFSLNIQTVSDAKLRIRNIVARWPGSTADITIFDNSRLKADFEQNRFGDSCLVRDSGYSLKEYLMTPLDNPQTPAETLYNESQIRTRNVVERSYGVWKRRFPIMKLLLRLKLDTTKTVIVSTAVLHNIAINMRDLEPNEENNLPLVHNVNFNQYLYQNANMNAGLVRQILIENYFQNLRNNQRNNVI